MKRQKGVMLIEGVQVAMGELKKVKDLMEFKIDGMTAFAKKYNITEPQVNFLLSLEAVARYKANMDPVLPKIIQQVDGRFGETGRVRRNGKNGKE